MSGEDKKMTGVTQSELLAEDPAQTRPPAQILLEDTNLVDSPAPEGTPSASRSGKAEEGGPDKKPMSGDGVSQAELVREDPAQTRPPAQILLEDTSVIKE
ncbi:MAG: hypothetical protein K2H64_06730 [Desulfovibrio sp.]|nr:hypothetical protein [Desulfovibrio sp.]